MTLKTFRLLIGLSLTAWCSAAQAAPWQLQQRPIPQARACAAQRLKLAIQREAGLHRPSASWLGKQRSAAEVKLTRLSLDSQTSPQQIGLAEARALLKQAEKKLGARFELQSQSKSRWIGYSKGKPIIVPGGLLQNPKLSADALAVILAHEAVHAHGQRSEAAADYRAVRYGLRRLWGERFSKQRALRAGFDALRAMYDEDFDVHHGGSQGIEINASGYPTLQSRWDIYRRAALGWKAPRVGKRHKEAEPELLTSLGAADYLGISPAALARLSKQPRGPVLLDTAVGPRYEKNNLDQFR